MLRDSLPETLCYHDETHTMEVADAAVRIGRHCRLSGRELELVRTAALLHDLGHSVSYEEHEAQGIIIAKELLLDVAVTNREKNIILVASKRPPCLNNPAISSNKSFVTPTFPTWRLPAFGKKASCCGRNGERCWGSITSIPRGWN